MGISSLPLDDGFVHDLWFFDSLPPMPTFRNCRQISRYVDLNSEQESTATDAEQKPEIKTLADRIDISPY